MEVQIRIAKENKTLVCSISNLNARLNTVESRYNEVPIDWQHLFAITKFRYVEVLFHIFYYFWGKENRSLYRGLRYIEVRFIRVPLYINNARNEELFSIWL